MKKCMEKNNTANDRGHDVVHDDDDLMDADEVDALMTKGSIVTIVLWFLCLYGTYFVWIPEETSALVYLEGREQVTVAVATLVFAISIICSILPYVTGVKGVKMSGILKASIVVQSIALLTNALMAFGPTVVVVDRVTKSPAFLTRYCEWIPIAGCMTFLTEAVDLSTSTTSSSERIRKGGRETASALFTAWMQCLSASAGLICPLCPNVTSWCVVMLISCLMYGVMFHRIWIRHQNLELRTREGLIGRTAADAEYLERLRFGYKLTVACTVCWAILVVIFFVNMAIHRLCPPDHPLRVSGLAMMMDCVFDFLSKAIYLKLIMTVHESVFEESGRSRRRLEELRYMLGVLWESSSDVIVISIRGRGGRISTMISPTFASILGYKNQWPHVSDGKPRALVIDMQEKQTRRKSWRDGYDEKESLLDSSLHVSKPVVIRRAYLINDGDLPFDAGSGVMHKPVDIDVTEHSVKEAAKVIDLTWDRDRNDTLSLHEMVKLDETIAKCELKISSHSPSATIGFLRDATERYRRGEAEQRAALETLARQRDAQAVNRFTRHEVKNGLLVSIELCETLRSTVVKTTTSEHASSSPSVSSRIAELDTSLHDILETVMAEAMARDVIHEVYQPKLEPLDVQTTIAVSSIMNPKLIVTRTDRYQMVCRPRDFPTRLLMDPQLLKYIHRNAVSNACKYGKQNGRITTEISYDSDMQLFEMKVINLPGANHADLVEMGDEACQAVFRKGRRLHAELDARDRNASHVGAVSSGDGAWIMQKCAYTLSGSCSIEFHPSHTVLTFQCPAKLAANDDGGRLPWGEAEKFAVPTGTWGIAVDDSGIQRKLLDRILGNAGIEKAYRVILGQSADEVRNLTTLMKKVIKANPNAKVLILMDENLDIVEEGTEVLVSGSSCLVDLLKNLTAKEEARVLALVRSANDSGEDIDIYRSRSHGFFPKAPMKPERVRQCLGELWFRRFYQSAIPMPMATTLQGMDLLSHQHHHTHATYGRSPSTVEFKIKNSLSFAGSLISEGVTQGRWPKIWNALDLLYESLILGEDDSKSTCKRGMLTMTPKLRMVIDLIRGMDRSAVPSEFHRKWTTIKETVLESLRASIFYVGDGTTGSSSSSSRRGVAATSG